MPNHPPRWLICLCGALVVPAIGCASYPSYDYYGGYGMPAGGAYPAGTYAPQPMMGAPATLGAPAPAMTLPPAGSTFPEPAGNQDAPQFDPQRDLRAPTEGNLVPRPRDLDARDPRGASRGGRDPGDLQPPPGARRPPKPDNELHSPFGGAASADPTLGEPLARLDAPPAAEPPHPDAAREDPFFEPLVMDHGSGGRRRIEARPVSDRFVVGAGGETAEESRGPRERIQHAGREVEADVSAFDYDKEGYAWLKGRIDLDPLTKTWQIIYSLGTDDEFGGALILSEIPENVDLEHDSIVIVTGRIDRKTTDQYRKATYRADSIKKLKRTRRSADSFFE